MHLQHAFVILQGAAGQAGAGQAGPEGTGGDCGQLLASPAKVRKKPLNIMIRFKYSGGELNFIAFLFFTF